MANSLTDLIPQMSVIVMETARENAVFPRAVNTDFSAEVAQKGDTIKINVMNEFTTRAITPAMTVPTSGMNDVDPRKTDLVLNQWFESPFVFTDKDVAEIVEQGRSEALASAVRAVVNKIDMTVADNYKKVTNYVGTSGNTPFGTSIQEAQSASRILSTGLAPKDGTRNLICDEFAYANALGLPQFAKVNEAGTDVALRTAMIPSTLGFNWWENQNIPTHTTGMSGTYAVDAAGSAGASTVVLDNGAGAAPTTPSVGDLFTITGSTQVYAVQAVATATPTANEVTVTVYPELDQSIADGDAVTIAVTGSYTVNQAFHPQAYALGIRSAAQVQSSPNPIIPTQTITDPVSGLVLTLKFFETYYQTVVAVSALWGTACPRPEFATRILG